MSDTLTRTVTGATVPVAGTYVLDPTHSSISFSVRHLGLAKVRGGFEVRSGTIVIAEDPTQSSVEAVIDASSFNTGTADRDAHVRSADFLDVEQYPDITFRSTGVRQAGDSWQIDGELTVRDVTRPVTLDVEFEGSEQDPWGNGRIAFSASTEINREDFGITWNQALESGGVLVGKQVKISIDLEAVAQG